MAKKDFRGEVWNNIDEMVLAQIVRINGEAVDGKVGHDSYTAKATAYLQSFFDEKIDVLYTINGTAANIVALKAMLASYGTVICAEQAHINTYECGALEYNLGNKILSIPTLDAKITPKMIEALLAEHESHQYRPSVVAITQPTELGTVYTLEEMKNLAAYAHQNGMKLFVDGARLGSALAALGVTLRQMMAETGVDVFTVGGTKAGAMFGEAVVFTQSNPLPAGEYILKQSMQHFDKSKFLGAQMLCLFENDRWINHFANANKMAKLLEGKLREKGIEIYLPVESNMVFCVLEKETLAKINVEYDLKYWFKDKRVVRIVTTFATTKQDIDALSALIG
ncbi:MAG: aminotransferase class I/II-fold pyridoxal phosphate-dependent enzyme [Clostridia bacterium]|nr:aminotransferase class I/II-fold pyridoxal phosphate-dependent enzyme [Clostridia bacterium]